MTYLAQARALGASLIIALNADGSARRLGKGDDRPVNRLQDRAAIVAALEATSLVTWFEEDTPLELILKLKPDVLVKGGDWRPEDIVGATEMRGLGRHRALHPVHARTSLDRSGIVNEDP